MVEKIWTIKCDEGVQDGWTMEVRLDEARIPDLLRLLLCQNLNHHEIISSVLNERPLLEVRKEGDHYFTVIGRFQYLAHRKNTEGESDG